MSSKFTVEPNQNPYAPPTVRRNVPAAAGGPANARAIRLQHLRLESAIAAFGWFHIGWGIVGLGFSLLDLSLMVWAWSGDNLVGDESWIGTIGGVCAGVFQIAFGMGLRQLDPGARISATIFNALTFISGVGIWFLVLAWAGSANYVFSPEYKEVVKATPGTKRHMTATAWILIAFSVLAVALVVVAILVLGWFIANALAEEGAEVATGLLVGF